ncbi:predicted protein, partial [Nematostella vectensis]
IIYNRVAKCGSRSMILLISELAVANGFKFINHPKTQHFLTAKQQLAFVDMVEQQSQSFIFTRHMYFIDFQRFGSVTPIYINLIRDPLSRLVSQYYFRRFGDGRNRTWDFKGSEAGRHRSFDECVITNRTECMDPNALFYVIPFFCGQSRKCRVSSKWAFRQALYNLVNRYLVVGILEEVDDFLTVLEKLLPNFFKGALEMWKMPETRRKGRRQDETRTKNKKAPSAEVVRIMKKRLHLEYEFYEAVKERFHRLKKEHGLADSAERIRFADTRITS